MVILPKWCRTLITILRHDCRGAMSLFV